MEELFYTKENYWVVIENDIATIGVTDFVINNMNIVNYVELPTIGNVCSKTDLLGVINYNDDENFELYSQLSGEIIDVNDSLIDNCEQILGNDIDNNWLYRISIESREELEEELMSQEEYEEYLENL
ncbi:MAG: glycine cleavage system protein H [Rickettsiales bacterium]|nr:glycine cleavage system protein H [Rickettsiales bacterium]